MNRAQTFFLNILLACLLLVAGFICGWRATITQAQVRAVGDTHAIITVWGQTDLYDLLPEVIAE